VLTVSLLRPVPSLTISHPTGSHAVISSPKES
jgi:hypothetical protein